MSVVPMQKVQAVVHQDDANAFLAIVQKYEAMEFVDIDSEDVAKANIISPHHNLYPRVQHAVQFLLPYEKKVGLWKKLREGTFNEISEVQVNKIMSDTDAVSSVVDDLEKIQVEFADANEVVRQLEERKKNIVFWRSLPFALSQLETKLTVTKLLVVKPSKTAGDFISVFTNKANENNFDFAITKVSGNQLAVTFEKKANLSLVSELIESSGADLVSAPEGTEAPEVELTAIEERLAKAKGEVALLHDQAEHFAITHLKRLQIAGEILHWEHDRYQVVADASVTKKTVVFAGWLNANKREAIEAEVLEKNLAAVFAEIELNEDEEPPVDIVNNPFVQPFEAVTRLYGMPGYRDLDPTVFLAGFFFLFFGLSLTDVGYGLTLMVVSAMILTLFKVSDTIRLFAKLLLFVGFATVLVGLLFGGYLGIDPTLLPPALQAMQMFDPIGDPLPVFYLALALGVFQVMVGLVLNIYSEMRQGRLIDGLLDKGPWLYMFVVGIAYVAIMTGYLTTVTAGQLTNLAYVGIGLIVVTSARKGGNIFQKVQASAGALYESIGYFSDILSYSRLLALGLATTALAFAVNLIAEIVSGSVPFLGPILGAIVLLIGHVFTLAVNTLGAFIHSARLQFVEFFGKFIAGTGKEFSPLSRVKKVITIVDE